MGGRAPTRLVGQQEKTGSGRGADGKRLGSIQVEVENTPLKGDVLEYMGFYRVLWRGGGG